MGETDCLRRALDAVRGIQSTLAPRATAADDTASHPPAVSEHPSPSVFISWAHSHSTWTPDQTTDWESQVAEFAATLRSSGIDADIDLFHLEETVDWTRFGPSGITNADWTVIVMSSAWAERWSGTNSPREGAGAAGEADTLRGLFARQQGEWQRRLVIVMLPDVTSDVVPLDLSRVTRVSIDSADPDSYEGLIRILTGQPRYPKPPLGSVPTYDSVPGWASERLQRLRKQLADTESEKRNLAGSRAGAEHEDEVARLDLAEAALRGFIESALKEDE